MQGKLDKHAHASEVGGPHDVPECSMDYCHLRKASSPTSVTVLLCKDRNSKIPMANVVTRKGRGQESAVEQAVTNIRRLGHGPILIKTDGEPALVDLRRAVTAALGTQAVPERPSPYEPQSNGAIEAGSKQFKGQRRTLCLALEDRIGG